jgi:protein gp37
VGCTIEDQQRAAQRLPHLVAIPAPVRFISAEPLLGPVDLTSWMPRLDWIIVGGESGAAARPAAIDWVRGLREEVTRAGKPLFFKQWGNWAPDLDGDQLIKLRRKDFRMLDGRTWEQLPVPRHG